MIKRSFLLLEVLIAFSLVLLCAVPLILKPIQIYRSEMQSLEEVEGERLADWTFSEIQELILQTEIPWEKLPHYQATTGPFSLPPRQIQVPGREAKKIERSFTLFGKGEKRGIRGEVYRMLYVKISFRPALTKKKKQYAYRLIVQKITTQI